MHNYSMKADNQALPQGVPPMEGKQKKIYNPGKYTKLLRKKVEVEKVTRFPKLINIILVLKSCIAIKTKTTELPLFHKRTTKLVFLSLNRGQLCFKVLIFSYSVF